MGEFVRLMTYPFLACLLLTGIHVYLGIHVISRKVIFVDLALAQIAALGAVYAALLGYELQADPWSVKGFSLLFALAGAAVFSLTRMRHQRVPQEAVIGIGYAVALAATVLASSHLAHGAEEVRGLLSGSILWVTGRILLVTAALYAAAGTVLALAHRKLIRISLDPEGARAAGVRIRGWDFLFYAVFGSVVTSSVAIGGVLLVFSFLVIPAVIAVLFAHRIGPRLAIGWGVGTVVSFLGVIASYEYDLPSGPTIVVALGAALALAATVRGVVLAPRPVRSALRAAGVAALLVAAVGGTLLLRKSDDRGALALARSPIKNERILAVRRAVDDEPTREALGPVLAELLADPEPDVRAAVLDLLARRPRRDLLPEIHALLTDPDDHVRETCLRTIGTLADPRSVEPLRAALASEEDEYIRIEIAHALLDLGEAGAADSLLDLMDDGSVSQVRKEAYENLASHLPVADLPFDADRPPARNDAEVKALRAWWGGARERLRFAPGAKRYVLEDR